MHSKWGPKPAHQNNQKFIQFLKKEHIKKLRNVSSKYCRNFMQVFNAYSVNVPKPFLHILEWTKFDNHNNLCKHQSFYRHEFIWFASFIMTARNIPNNLLSTNAIQQMYHLVSLFWWHFFPTFNAQLARWRDSQYKNIQIEQAAHCKPLVDPS